MKVVKKLMAFVTTMSLFAGMMFVSVLTVSAAPEDKLKYSPPPLVNPEIIHINNENCKWSIAKHTDTDPAGRDFIIVVDEKITKNDGINLDCSGARNVVWIGGEIWAPWAGEYDDPYRKGRRGLMLSNWTGVLHIEGLWIHGEDLAEAINVDNRNPGCVFQIQNYRCDDLGGRPEELEVGFKDVNHPDAIQNWGGPTYYLVDHMTAETMYQGFMVQPIQYDENMVTKYLKWSNLNIIKTERPGYQVFFVQAGTEVMDVTENVYLDDTYGVKTMAYYTGSSPMEYPNPPWDKVIAGRPEVDFCIAGEEGGVGIAGMKYISPGYTGDGYPEEMEIITNDLLNGATPITELPENFPTSSNPDGIYGGTTDTEEEATGSATDEIEDSLEAVITPDTIPDNTTGGIAVLIDGETQSFDPAPVLMNDRTLIPMRAIFEKLGAQVSWDSGTGEITAQKDDMTLSMYIGNSTAKVNGEDISLDVPAQLLDDRTMVPLRFVSETLQCKVEWVGEKQTVVIRTGAAVQQ